MTQMRSVLVVVLFLAMLLPGCQMGMLRASEIKPAVDVIVADYVALIPESDPLKAKKVALANELKQTVDLAAEGGE